MRNTPIQLIVLLVILTPWLLLLFSFNNKSVALSCVIPFHIEITQQQKMAMHGTLKTSFYDDLTAISFLSGYFHQANLEGNKDDFWRINRRAVARYEINNNYLHITTSEAHSGFGDTLPQSLSDTFIHPLFKSQHRDYLQLNYLPNNDVLIHATGMPPLYCHAV